MPALSTTRQSLSEAYTRVVSSPISTVSVPRTSSWLGVGELLPTTSIKESTCLTERVIAIRGVVCSASFLLALPNGRQFTVVVGDVTGYGMKGAMNAVMADAGHHAHPLLVRDGAVDPLVSKGMPLGMMAGISYQEIEFELQSGDVIVFMTDGIIEAKDSSGQEYQDTGRLQQVLGGFTLETPAEAMVTALIDDATTFGANMTAEEEDDITVVVVKVL